jgi:hypothetical protein
MHAHRGIQRVRRLQIITQRRRFKANEVLSRGNMSSKLSALAEVDATGAFVRSASKFTSRIGSAQFPAAAGRYMLYVSLACPWACRTLALRALKGLEDVVPVTVVAPRWARTKPLQDEHMGWVFKSCAHPGDADLAEVPWTEPVFQANSIRAVYEAAAPDVQHVKASSYVLQFNMPPNASLKRPPSPPAPAVHGAAASRHSHSPNCLQRERAHHARL